MQRQTIFDDIRSNRFREFCLEHLDDFPNVFRDVLFHVFSPLKVIRPGAGSPDNLEEVDELLCTGPPVMGNLDLLFQVLMGKEYAIILPLSSIFLL